MAAPRCCGGRFTRFSYAATVAEVSVDEDTGQVSVDKIWCPRLWFFLPSTHWVGGKDRCTAVYGWVWPRPSAKKRYWEGLHMNSNSSRLPLSHRNGITRYRGEID